MFGYILLAACTTVSAAAEGVKVVPVSDQDVENRKKRVAYLLTLNDEQLVAMVPVQSGAYVGDCPNCDTGTQDYIEWIWKPQKPHVMTCSGCGETYPNNPKYPDDHMLKVAAPEGEHEYPYHQRENDSRIYFRAIRDYWARRVMEKHCQDLAELWWLTKEDDYARRATIILHRFAQVYPGYAYTMSWPFRDSRFSPWNKPTIEGVAANMTSKGGAWNYATLDVSRELVPAYDCVRLWPGLDDATRNRIENDLFGIMVSYPIGKKDTYGNMSPTMWRDFVRAGRVLNKPEWMREAMRRVDHFMTRHFLYDGYWREPSPSYCGQVYWYIKSVFEALPPQIPEEIKPVVDRAKLGLKTLAHFNGDLVFPNGKLLTLSDTWSYNSRSKPTGARPTLVPGLGVAIFRNDEYLAWLNFAPGAGHAHRDALGIGLWAHGKELLRDIGYTHIAWRAWTVMTHSHNTVVVNGTASEVDKLHNLTRLRVFASDGDKFHLAEAESDAAYPGVTSRYRRTIAWIDDSYLIDIFQIHGGKQHDYLLHGSADEDSSAAVQGATLQPFDGTLLNDGVKFTYPTAESAGYNPQHGYGYFTDLQSGKADDAMTLDLRLAASPSVGTRTHLLCEPGPTAYLGQTPRIREAKREDSLASKFMAPSFCVRRAGKDLHSTFVAVHEPINGDSKIDQVSVRRISDAIILTINRIDGSRDIFTSALDRPVTIAEGSFHFSGRYGWLRARGDQVEQTRLVGAKAIGLGDAKTSAAPGWSGAVERHGRVATADSRGWFEVDAVIPTGASIGALLIEFADRTVRGFNVVRIEPRADGTRLHVREDPGFDIDGEHINLTSSPQRTIQGAALRYDLPALAK